MASAGWRIAHSAGFTPQYPPSGDANASSADSSETSSAVVIGGGAAAFAFGGAAWPEVWSCLALAVCDVVVGPLTVVVLLSPRHFALRARFRRTLLLPFPPASLPLLLLLVVRVLAPVRFSAEEDVEGLVD